MSKLNTPKIAGALIGAALFLLGNTAFATVINFDQDDQGNNLIAGSDFPSATDFDDLGVTFSAASGQLNYFNSTCTTGSSGTCTGNDDDLSFGLGNVLILQENNVALSNPNDEAGGGTIVATFATAVFLETIGFGDLETDGNLNAFSDQEARVTVFDINGVQIFQTIVGNGNGLTSSIDFGLANVGRVETQFRGSGSITSFAFAVPAPATLGLLGLGLLGFGARSRRR